MKGLSFNEAKARLNQFGFNELPASKPKSIWTIAFEVFREPMFLLLISCSTLYILLGDYREGIILFGTISIIIVITFYQYQKTERALEALRNLSSPRALVIRDGTEIRIPGREVVPGDLVKLNEGDRVPSDGDVLDSTNLKVDESMLTGESVPVVKDDEHKQVFSGTLVVQGTGIMITKTTGLNTAFGKIGASLTNITREETRLQKEMKLLIRNLFIISIAISFAVVILYYITRGDLLHSFLNGLSASMALLPEEFPVVMTIFLAMGAWRLSKKSVLTRSPAAIETLGSATILCCDKTGTITQNKMELVAVYDGSTIYRKDNYGDNADAITAVVNTGYFATRPDSVDPMETAIIRLNTETKAPHQQNHELVREYPLTRNLLAMTRVLKAAGSEDYVISAKGAPESIFRLCELTPEEQARHTSAVHKMASDGLRVLAIATSADKQLPLPSDQQDLDFRFIGLIGLEDPIRAEVPAAVKECYDAGVKIMMITGDYPDTAKSIGAQVGLAATGQMLTGPELDQISDDELRSKITGVTICARVVPEQKLRIVKALQAAGEIVAMTGDGVNDAPALKAADIGIAMGNKGTDVAREASSLVLLDDNFASIVSAIRSGRRIYDNLQKAMSYILAIHVPIVGLTLIPAFIPSLPILLLPLHIVFMELIIDPVCSVAFETEREEKDIMIRKPRPVDKPFFGVRKILASTFAGFLLLAMVLTIYFSSLGEGHSEGEIRAIAFSALILGNVFLILTNLSKTRSVVSVLAERNWVVLGILATAIIMLAVVMLVPALRLTFSFEFPGSAHFTPVLLGVLIVTAILEILKRIRLSQHAGTR